MTATDVRDDGGVAETKVRTLRVDDKLWEACQALAKRERLSLSDVMRQALIGFLREHGEEVPE